MIENFSLNKKLFLFINSLTGKNIVFDNISIFLAEYLIYILIFTFLFYFGKQIWRDRKIEIREFVIYFSASVSAWVFSKIIKKMIYAERPFYFFKIETLEKHKQVFDSFPSGHTTLAFALATSVYLYNKKIGFLFFILAFGVAFGRILVGVHYPLDVFVGAILGIIVAVLIGGLLKKKIE